MIIGSICCRPTPPDPHWDMEFNTWRTTGNELEAPPGISQYSGSQLTLPLIWFNIRALRFNVLLKISNVWTGGGGRGSYVINKDNEFLFYYL
jgi:hypothetical protein